MADTDRPTRWQKARDDWPGFQRRDPIVGAVALVLAVIGLLVFGRPGEAVEEVLIAAGAGLLATVLYPLGQLVWAWLQAPMRLLTADVIAVRERVEATPIAPQPAPTAPNLRLMVLNFIRMAREHLDSTSAFGGPVDEYLQTWTQDVFTRLHEHASESVAEGFLMATETTGRLAFQERIEYLQELMDNDDSNIPF